MFTLSLYTNYLTNYVQQHYNQTSVVYGNRPSKQTYWRRDEFIYMKQRSAEQKEDTLYIS